MQACGELQSIGKAAAFSPVMPRCRSSSSNSGASSSGIGINSIRSSSWNLSWECLQDRSIAECSFGLEVRNPADHSTSTPSVSSSSSSGATTLTSSQPTWTRIATGCVTLDRQGTKALHSGLDFLKRIQTVAVRGVIHSGMEPGLRNSRLLPANAWLGAVAVVILVAMLKLGEILRRPRGQGQAVKRRIMNSKWFKESRLENGKRKPDDAELKPDEEENSELSMFDRLLIHDGEVIKGVEPGAVFTSRRRIRSEGKAPVDSSPELQGGVSRIRSFLTRPERKARPLFRGSDRASAGDDNREKDGGFYQRKWDDKDELDLRHRVEELRQSVQAAETNRKAAIHALAEERKRSLELEVKIRRQKEAAAALEEEVRVLKESHEALLNSLRKKYSSSASARAAAALLYQNWDESSEPTR